MYKYFTAFIMMLSPLWAYAGITSIFKDENGKTNWQILANWTSGTLIILLSIVVVSLFVARRRAHKANRELDKIRRELEARVKERTATLDESNRLLTQSNTSLEEEVRRHVQTSERLKSSEAYIRDILTSMPMMLVGLDKEGRVTQWNKRVEEVSGIPADQALGRTLWEAYPTVTVSPEQIKDAIENQNTIHLKQSLRSVSHYDITIYPLKEQAEPGVVILVDDVTKQTAAENMLIHNDKMSFMGELASTMAHDINAPLQTILLDLKSFQRILAESSATYTNGQAEQARGLQTILEDMSEKGDQVSSIISNLLAFARSRKQEKQWVNAVDIMENAIRIANDVVASPTLAFSDIHIERHFGNDLPLVPCYVTELQQVFISLFRHCVQAIEERKQQDADYQPVIKLLLAECYDSLWVKIQHNGTGLTNEEQMYLFEPFFSQLSPEQDFDAGQRLSFSYYIITEQHQGHMAVTSDLRIGSTFHMQLPIE